MLCVGVFNTQLRYKDRAKTRNICRKTSYIANYDPNIALSQYELTLHFSILFHF